MEPMTNTTVHLVKSEDLNHHGTLYAGRNAEWFIEAGFIAAAGLVPARSVVCLKIHGMTFTRPVRLGELARFTSKIIANGRSRLIAHVEMKVGEEEVVRGFITFVHVDEEVHAVPHGITITPSCPEDIQLQQEALALK